LSSPSARQRQEILLSVFARQHLTIHRLPSLPLQQQPVQQTGQQQQRHQESLEQEKEDVTQEVVHQAADLAHGYVAADLVRLVKEAVLIHLMTTTTAPPPVPAAAAAEGNGSLGHSRDYCGPVAVLTEQSVSQSTDSTGMTAARFVCSA
jgi:SpoVK/Ycf46/Vps4 family AAA+-type ATPase